MKLRVTSDDLRLRLSADDITLLRNGEPLRESLALSSQRLRFELVCEGTEAGAVLADATIRVNVPAAQAIQWVTSEAETLRCPLASGAVILIEKDKRP